jgi:FAD/FMN-containing dehydrogenase
MDRHNEAVAIIASDFRQFHERKKPFRIYHGSTNTTRQSQFTRDATIDITELSRVLKVDRSTKTALVEPNVPMDRLVEATLQYGLLPPVVMEFPGITVEGGFAGTGGESSSFRHGFFDRTVNWIEIVLPDGDIVTASNTDKRDLFHGAASSFGTLGITTLLELQLIDAKTYVGLTYHPVFSMRHARGHKEN